MAVHIELMSREISVSDDLELIGPANLKWNPNDLVNSLTLHMPEENIVLSGVVDCRSIINDGNDEEDDISNIMTVLEMQLELQSVQKQFRDSDHTEINLWDKTDDTIYIIGFEYIDLTFKSWQDKLQFAKEKIEGRQEWIWMDIERLKQRIQEEIKNEQTNLGTMKTFFNQFPRFSHNSLMMHHIAYHAGFPHPQHLEMP
jgi:hypothetical protein